MSVVPAASGGAVRHSGPTQASVFVGAKPEQKKSGTVAPVPEQTSFVSAKPAHKPAGGEAASASAPPGRPGALLDITL